jgi:hypothetical protein
MITADAFKILINKYNCTDALFQKYFLYFLNAEWDALVRDENGVPLSADDNAIMQCLRNNWINWTVTDKSLQELNNKDYPDEIYFCGASLNILYKANLVIGDDMIFSPAELASQLV